ncbi:MAG: hypothetical protein FE044_02465 [Thermoplasmata archaeon]|nr:MAG: hypothetical protein FE044_02465 [Thermoplasmata archaeon]
MNRKMKIKGIERECLETIKEGAKALHPREFLALLSVGNDKSIISEIVMLPQMTYGKRHATFNIYMAPIDFSIVGTVHSHPSGYPVPSQDDLITFSKNGIIHIIIAYPYDDTSWKAYNSNGEEVKLKIIE